jgi:hypothetical protein
VVEPLTCQRCGKFVDNAMQLMAVTGAGQVRTDCRRIVEAVIAERNEHNSVLLCGYGGVALAIVIVAAARATRFTPVYRYAALLAVASIVMALRAAIGDSGETPEFRLGLRAHRVLIWVFALPALFLSGLIALS